MSTYAISPNKCDVDLYYRQCNSIKSIISNEPLKPKTKNNFNVECIRI